MSCLQFLARWHCAAISRKRQWTLFLPFLASIYFAPKLEEAFSALDFAVELLTRWGCTWESGELGELWEWRAVRVESCESGELAEWRAKSWESGEDYILCSVTGSFTAYAGIRGNDLTNDRHVFIYFILVHLIFRYSTIDCNSTYATKLFPNKLLLQNVWPVTFTLFFNICKFCLIEKRIFASCD